MLEIDDEAFGASVIEDRLGRPLLILLVEYSTRQQSRNFYFD